VSIVITIVAVAIIGGVIVVARGLGGELARDRAPLPSELDVRTGAEVARYRPPPALLGYQPEATERAFSMIGRSIAERDEEIAWLRDRLAELQPEQGWAAEQPLAVDGSPGSVTASQPDADPSDPERDSSDRGGSDLDPSDRSPSDRDASDGDPSDGDPADRDPADSDDPDADDSDTGSAVRGAASQQR
jgi:hypothetical protein